MRVTGLSAAALASASLGCAREPIGSCPATSPGELVVTELRGDQDPDDDLGQWVELYNASTGSLDLEGVRLRFRRLDGSSEIDVLVRRSLPVEPGGYVVLGLYNDDNRPSFVDYGFGSDYTQQSMLAAAALDVEACTDQLDRARYSLPNVGSYSLGGAPNVDNNDVLTEWCTSATPDGTPGLANPPCP